MILGNLEIIVIFWVLCIAPMITGTVWLCRVIGWRTRRTRRIKLWLSWRPSDGFCSPALRYRTICSSTTALCTLLIATYLVGGLIGLLLHFMYFVSCVVSLQFFGFQYSITFSLHISDVKKQYPSYSTKWNSSIVYLSGYHLSVKTSCQHGKSSSRLYCFSVTSVARRLAVGCGDQLLIGRHSNRLLF